MNRPLFLSNNFFWVTCKKTRSVFEVNWRIFFWQHSSGNLRKTLFDWNEEQVFLSNNPMLIGIQCLDLNVVQRKVWVCQFCLPDLLLPVFQTTMIPPPSSWPSTSSYIFKSKHTQVTKALHQNSNILVLMSLLNLPYLPNNDTSTIILTINIIVSLSEKSQKHDTSKQHHSFDQPIKPCSLDFVKSVHGGKINVLVGMRGKCKVNIFQYGWRFRPTGPFIRPPLITSVSSTFSVCFAKLDRIYFWHSCLRSSHWFRFFSISSPQPPSS